MSLLGTVICQSVKSDLKIDISNPFSGWRIPDYSKCQGVKRRQEILTKMIESLLYLILLTTQLLLKERFVHLGHVGQIMKLQPALSQEVTQQLRMFLRIVSLKLYRLLIKF